MGKILRHKPDGSVWFETVTREQETAFREAERNQWLVDVAVQKAAAAEQAKADAAARALAARFAVFTDDEIRAEAKRRNIILTDEARNGK